jgi:beta-N-acetylhexosaminidase
MSHRTRTGRLPSRFPVLARPVVVGVAALGFAGLLATSCSSGKSKPATPTSSSSSTPAPSTLSTSSTPSPSTSSSTTATAKPPTTSSSPSSSSQPATGLTGLPANLTPLQIAGQRVVYSYSGLIPPESLLQAIRNGQVGGVIFFSGNISDEQQIGGVVNQLRQAQAQSPVKLPLLLMTDQEGGIVRRLPGAPALSAKQIGQSANPTAAAADAGAGAAANLAGVGMNLNLAPVLDVYYQAGNFDDAAQRSFSNNPDTVARLGSAFIVAQQAKGVAATGKHFPGLGSAPNGANTDLQPVTLTVSLNNLRTVDEVPFKAAISAGVKLVMLSWAVYPSLDANHPAGMSSTIVQQELRNQLGFKGVTITDALEAGAINSFGGPGQRGVAAAGAGMDVLLASSGNVNQGIAVTQALADARGNGTLNRAGFDAAVNRVSALRGTLH